jgi:phosphoribosyl 1,2-cyclic phosphate phosphodiesterase
LLRENVGRIDGVWFTHVHADHLHGIDDLRVFSMRSRRRLDGFASESTCATIERRFDYIFDPAVRPGAGSSKPHLELHRVRAGEPSSVVGESIFPIEAPHGPDMVTGFRVGDLGYITDAKRLPDDAMRLLDGVRVLVLNALWWGDPHPTHFNVEEAVETARRVGAERTYLTHFAHRSKHTDLEERLPAGVAPAYDGLTVEVAPDGDTADTRAQSVEHGGEVTS